MTEFAQNPEEARLAERSGLKDRLKAHDERFQAVMGDEAAEAAVRAEAFTDKLRLFEISTDSERVADLNEGLEAYQDFAEIMGDEMPMSLEQLMEDAWGLPVELEGMSPTMQEAVNKILEENPNIIPD